MRYIYHSHKYWSLVAARNAWIMAFSVPGDGHELPLPLVTTFFANFFLSLTQSINMSLRILIFFALNSQPLNREKTMGILTFGFRK